MLLERFVRRALHRLDDDELRALERLLDQPDQDILEWITSATATPPPEVRDVVDRIRAHALGRACVELPTSLSEARIEDGTERV